MIKEKKIVIADDDPGILDSLCIMLEFEGYQVKCTPIGTDLLAMDQYPDLVLLDIWMSGVDGRDICKQLKKQPETSNIPIIMISASNEIEHSARAAGANDFVAKPFSISSLLETIEKHISQTN